MIQSLGILFHFITEGFGSEGSSEEMNEKKRSGMEMNDEPFRNDRTPPHGLLIPPVILSLHSIPPGGTP